MPFDQLAQTGIAPSAPALDYAPPTVPPETVLVAFHRQGRALTLPLLLLLIIAAASGYFVGSFAEPWLNWLAAGSAAAIALFGCITPLLTWLTSRVTITSRRVIVRRGVVVHQRNEIPLSLVREVRSRRGPIQRLFRSGDIELRTDPDAAATVLRDVPGAVHVVDALHELLEQQHAHGWR